MLKNYLRTAFRNLTRNAATSGLNVLGLAVGMTAAVLIFLWVDNELTFDSYHPGAGRIYRLTTHYTTSGWVWASSSLALQQRLKTDIPGIAAVTSMAPAYETDMYLSGELIAEKTGAYVDSSWFSIFHYDFVAGSPASFNRNPYSLILTQTKAKKYFGSRDPIGRTIRVGSIPYQVAAVIRDNPANSSFPFDILMPIAALLADSNSRKEAINWDNYSFLNFVKLQPNIGPTPLGPAITNMMHKHAPETGDNTITLLPLKDMHFEQDLSTSDGILHANSKKVTVFGIVGVFLLLIACINYVNLTTARASLRAKEIGIRKIIGAARTSLFTQFLLESILVSILSLAVTVLLIIITLPFFREITETTFRSPLTNLVTWKIIGLALLAATILNGVYPALLLSSFRPLNVIKGAITIKFKDVYLRKGLVVLQFTFSIVLIASTIIIQRQLQYIRHTSPGYDRSQVFTLRIPWQVLGQKSETETRASATGIRQRLLTNPSIIGVSFASASIVGMENANEGSANWDGKDPNFVPVVFQMGADENFKELLGLEMLQGRWFGSQQPTDQHKGIVGAASPRSSSPVNFEHSFILNETAIRRFNIRRPVVGQRFFFQGDTGRIVGIVRDFHFASMHEAIGPLVLLDRPSWQTIAYIKTAPGKTTEALAAARTLWSQLIPDKPFDYNFLDEAFDDLYKADTRAADLILIFSGIAILISCLGLIGLAAFTARTRIREIGIRKVLGASVTNILTLLSRDFIRLVGLSILIATPIAWWAMHLWLRDFAYHISLNPWTFAAAGLLAITIAALTIATQSIRAARANPVKNLRTD